MKKIVIIGGGASGTIAALHLLNRFSQPLDIKIIDKNPINKRGIAYSPLKSSFLLNVPCSKMGVYPNQPDGFFNWLLHKGYPYKGLSFVPRILYGEYLNDLLETAIKTSKNHRCQIIQTEIKNIETGNKIQIETTNTECLEADELIIAIGNFPPKNIKSNSNLVENNPWENSILDTLSTTDDIAILGTGLTAIDFVNELYQRKHQGKIYMISRNGKFPLAHEEPCMQGLLQNYYSADDSLRTIIRKTNQIKRHPFLKIIRPVCVIEELRNLFPRMWYHWSTEEKELFYRRLFTMWNIQRHRIPPHVDTIISELKERGQLIVLRGSLDLVEEKLSKSVNQLAIHYKESISKEVKTVSASILINCTGPESDFTKIKDPFIQKLLEKELIQTDELKTGLLSNSKFQLKGKNGFHQNIRSIGPPLKSMFFESSAIHEIRNQAAALCEHLLASDS